MSGVLGLPTLRGLDMNPSRDSCRFLVVNGEKIHLLRREKLQDLPSSPTSALRCLEIIRSRNLPPILSAWIRGHNCSDIWRFKD